MRSVAGAGDLAALSAVELRAGYAATGFSPVEVHAAVQARINRLEPTINALSAHDPDASAAAARDSEARWQRGKPLGPLDGIPVTVKENLARVGIPMRFGCAGTEPVWPVRDAPVVERLAETGAVLVGSTTMPDWGMLSSGVSSLHGLTRSPADPDLTTGGSSAGAGAATAAGYGPVHVGTDIGGSIRLPAAWLGVVGYKPSFGRVPLDAPYLGRAAGPLTRTVPDAALALSVLSRPDVRDWSALPPAQLDWSLDGATVEGLRVGLLLDAGCGMPCRADVRSAVAEAAAVFEAGGAAVEPMTGWLGATMLADVDLFWRVRSLVDLRRMPPQRREQVLPYAAQWALGGQSASGTRVLEAYQSILAMRATTVAETTAYDLVLSPVAPVPAFPAHWSMPWGDDPGVAMAHIGFTVPFSMSGQPACSVPAGRLGDGREVGLQIAGRRFDDVGVLRAAAWFEAARCGGAP